MLSLIIGGKGEMGKGSKKRLVRQVVFREDGSLTDVPVKDSEKPQLEKQSELFQFEKDQKNLKRLRDAAHS